MFLNFQRSLLLSLTVEFENTDISKGFKLFVFANYDFPISRLLNMVIRIFRNFSNFKIPMFKMYPLCTVSKYFGDK